MNGMELLTHLKAVKEEQQWADILDKTIREAEARGMERAAKLCEDYVFELNTGTRRGEIKSTTYTVGKGMAEEIRAYAAKESPQ